jgi:uncharacterized metal-binding protein YceD (DUF177 family)
LLVDRLPPEGTEVVVETTEEERAALAADFKLPAIHALEGRYRVTGSSRGVSVVGRIRAKIAQECVVTLEPFDSTIDEEVALDFAPPRDKPAATGPDQPDTPDEIVAGRIDLGTITAEFLALGLDPYPKKPGVDFSYEEGGEAAADSPFAALGRLKGDA